MGAMESAARITVHISPDFCAAPRNLVPLRVQSICNTFPRFLQISRLQSPSTPRLSYSDPK